MVITKMESIDSIETHAYGTKNDVAKENIKRS